MIYFIFCKKETKNFPPSQISYLKLLSVSFYLFLKHITKIHCRSQFAHRVFILSWTYLMLTQCSCWYFWLRVFTWNISVPIKSKNMIREKIASSRQFLSESPKQLEVLGGAVNPPRVLNTLKLRIVAPIFIQLILIF